MTLASGLVTTLQLVGLTIVLALCALSARTTSRPPGGGPSTSSPERRRADNRRAPARRPS